MIKAAFQLWNRQERIMYRWYSSNFDATRALFCSVTEHDCEKTRYDLMGTFVFHKMFQFCRHSCCYLRFPGPETTLSMLLNLEVYEIVPGTVSDSGVILSIHDPNDSSSQHHTDGIHLEAGKLVTIPINEVRKVWLRFQMVLLIKPIFLNKWMTSFS